MADARGYVYEHRLVASQTLGRPLRRGEVVHHVNEDKLDNRPENLEVLQSMEAHNAQHRTRIDLRVPGTPNPYVDCECGCGDKMPRFDSEGRPRRFMTGHYMPPRNSLGQFEALPRTTPPSDKYVVPHSVPTFRPTPNPGQSH
ncbi:HNH endonuclease [Mycobacteroides sp. PCS013]|uniref:HNH endonuclease n=1 Tax=Mycobacteroides sp. PCS013 TaxID=3074106 RepID=UPI003C2AF818